ncbi:MAG: response regulator [Thiobacillus sp.]|nr:response regulator [Thiobacillus sp.]
MNRLQQILYVEDEPDIQAVAKPALEMVGGFTVKVCSSGEEALREAEAFAPDLIRLDVMMMDGPGTRAAVGKRPATTHVPVVFMTAKVQPAEAALYKSLGALDAIPKPLDSMNLSNQARTIWDGHAHG